MKQYAITEVQAVRYPILRIVFEDGLAGELDLSDEIAHGEMFAPLKDPEYFRQVAVAPGGRSFGWNLDEIGGEIDFCADATRIEFETRIVTDMAERFRHSRQAAE